MGLIQLDLKMLKSCLETKRPIRRVATIGRLSLYIHSSEISELEGFNGKTLRSEYRWGDNCEQILRDFLGAEEIVSFDASSYEGATRQFDFNSPLFVGDEDRFDLVIDGGSLEHIFNFPIAVSNIMKLVSVNGYVLTANPCNCLSGHGFYQFSPELMFRVFSPENGFVVERMILTEHRFASVELAPPLRVVEVKDPATVRQRILITSGKPLMVRCLAQRVDALEPFQVAPQQSDYVARWTSDSPVGASKNQNRTKSAIRKIYQCIPSQIRYRIDDFRNNYSISNEKFFKDI